MTRKIILCIMIIFLNFNLYSEETPNKQNSSGLAISGIVGYQISGFGMGMGYYFNKFDFFQPSLHAGYGWASNWAPGASIRTSFGDRYRLMTGCSYSRTLVKSELGKAENNVYSVSLYAGFEFIDYYGFLFIADVGYNFLGEGKLINKLALDIGAGYKIW
jgi:hypothetical protein